MTDTQPEPHVHYWLFDKAEEGKRTGSFPAVCKKCGAKKGFRPEFKLGVSKRTEEPW
ncbi:MAG: hypothetical protein Q7J73_08175 [Dehalococcoidales bacterium]|nr:hypothetical protein [Dehalococcoidales bacterium]